MRSDKAAIWRMAGFGVAALLFSVLVIAVRARWVPLESLDRGVADGLNALVAPHRPLVTLMGGISRLGSFGVLAWLVAIAAILLLVRRRLRLAGFLVATTLGGLVLDPTLKLAVGRLRPVVERPVAHGGGNSFPSGHALNSFICYAVLLVVFLPALPARWRRPALLAGGVVVLLIGFSRLALGVHFLSDVTSPSPRPRVRHRRPHNRPGRPHEASIGSDNVSLRPLDPRLGAHLRGRRPDR
ncbi:phosphatase PAP2 family protein [Dactylosporangium sp. NPDC051485]|uniref:phosphatase PAP2 family protein n=1 Tax=Dactylosporangium sp. NPDC051485 TaxID=3154846 RepID=UPI0034493699